MAPSRRPLHKLVSVLHPDLDAVTTIEGGNVRVNGAVITNPASLARADDSIVVTSERRLKGQDKLGSGLDKLGIESFDGHVGLDIGACTGGFTKALLERGAAKVYAVDVGHGQLLGSLRQDPRVVNLERVNASELTTQHVDQPVDVIVVDVSYSPLRAILGDVTSSVDLQPQAKLVGLVKPMFELQSASLPTSQTDLARSVESARAAAVGAGWTVIEIIESPLRGNNGAIEYFLYGVMSEPADS